MNPTHWSHLLWKRSFLFLLVFLSGCFSSDESPSPPSERYQHGEYIYRTHEDFRFKLALPQPTAVTPYPWEEGKVGDLMKITKEFFRCKGCNLNPAHVVKEKEEMVRYYDCNGSSKHSLPLRGNKEFIYPILLDLLNYLQLKTHKRVVITSGHRCPEHNSYVDASTDNRYSKHLIGAEVSFYVQGMEEYPERLIPYLQQYYKDTAKYQGKKEYVEFQRYEKGDTNVSTPPWSNKEIFVKVFKKKEGRNFDNRHPYPYMSIQVRYDFDKQEKVIYSWDKANHNYLRY